MKLQMRHRLYSKIPKGSAKTLHPFLLRPALLARSARRRRRTAAGETGLIDGIRAGLAEAQAQIGYHRRHSELSELKARLAAA
jgi:hypothetical protein